MKAWLGLVLAVCAFAQVVDQARWDALADQIRRQGEPVDANVREYVRRLGTRVVAGEAWTVEAMDGGPGEGTFAVWMPGHVFVPVRALALARSEAEVAALVAHAMSHRVELRPGAIPLVAGEGRGPEEIRADQAAVGRMVKAGYPPQALLDYLERVARIVPPERVAALKEAIAAAPKQAESIENTSAFVEMQARVRVAEPVLPRKAPTLYRYSK